MTGRLVGRLLAGSVWLLLTACAGVSDDRPEAVRQSERYLQRGVAAFGDDDYVTAANLFSKALLHYQSYDDAEGVLLSRINLAETALALANFTAADRQLTLAEQLIHADASLGEHRARLVLLRASSAVEQGAAERGLALLVPLLPDFDADGRPGLPITPTATAALVLRTRIAWLGDDSPALWTRRLQRSLVALGETSPSRTARLKRFQAQLMVSEGREDAADALYREALGIYRELAARRGIAQTLEEWAELSIVGEDWQGAHDRLQRALLVRSWYHDRRGVARILDSRARIFAAQGDRQRALVSREWAARLRGDVPIDWAGVRQAVEPAP